MVCKSFYNIHFEITLLEVLFSKALKHSACTFYSLIYSQRAVQEKRKDL